MESAKIMIVEDNTTVAEDCRDCLENLGYGVAAVVASGEESIKRAETERPDAILMDIHLRDEMDGIEAAEQIHARFEIPIVFLSAYSDRKLLERAKLVGSFGFLIKPFEERELCSTLEMALYRAKVEKERAQMGTRLQQAQKMEAVATLAGGTAHQFNNALSAVTGNIDLLEASYPGDKNVANCAERIRDSVHRMTQLTAQLLAYSRGGGYEPKIVSLSDFVRDVLPLIKHTIDPTIRVDTELSHDSLNVEADLAQMQMVLSAVLINAAEAMEGKGGCVRVGCKKVIVTDDTTKDIPELKPGSYACLTVTDDGKGMDEDTRQRVCEPFFTTKFPGRGLGMAAAYGIVESHDGRIQVDSELGKGTVASIYLPIIEIPVSEDAEPERQTELICGTGTILIIEDETPIMKVIRAVLEKLGYSVLEARTGQEAIDIVKNFESDIDLAMLDFLLPDMNGGAIYPFLMEARPSLKVIVFSGYSIDEPIQKVLNAGAEDFIQKPFTAAELSAKLKKVLGS